MWANFAVCASVFVVTCLGAPGSRIINGYDAEEGQIPYQALLYVAGNPSCGGSILSSQYVLTAAQCVVSSGYTVWPPQLFSVRVGSVTLNRGLEVRIANITIDTRYIRFQTDYDIALLKLATPLQFGKDIQPIPLSKASVPTGAQVQISGFGRLSLDANIPTHTLQFYDGVTVLSAKECEKKVDADGTIMCLGHRQKRGACTGDFGGPAVYKGKLVGVGSFSGNGSCGTDLPDGYTKVASYYDWIQKNMV